MSRSELRILFVEDSPEDMELELRELRKGGLEFRALRVETRDGLLEALRDFQPHVVVSDHTLPQLDGLSALQLSRETCPEVPFIFVSGTIGEERAVASLKEGATDYVLKGRLAGFARVVERAVREARERAGRRKLEEEFRQAQKMEAVGRLAGGVAHDFNNLLTVILGYGQMVRERLGPDSPCRPDLDEVLRASERAASLSRQLLAFSRKQVLQLRVLDLNAVIAEMEKLLGRVIGEDVRLLSRLDPALGRVRVDPGQIEQVILNLAINARDAMPDGGVLRIETSNVEADPEGVDAFAAPQVLLSVSDTGLGMTEDVMARLFEPFFTTKEPGKGTGLGLSTAYGIIAQSGGTIRVRSAPGQGSTFGVYLPRVHQPLDARLDGAPKAAGSACSETILLVEDEEPVRNLVRSVLSKEGYTVLEAVDGAAALSAGLAREAPIHLLLTDVIMPGMGGRELALRLRASRPSIKALFLSGHVEEGATRGILDGGIPFLAKPFTPQDLVRRVRDVLDAPA